LSKWREQGALYNESTGSKIRSEIDSMRYEIKGNRKHIRKERDTIHPTITTRIFSSNHRTFALNFGQKLRLHTIAVVSQNLPTNPVYMKMIPIYRNLMSPLAVRVELLSPRIMDPFSLKENNNFNGFTKNRKPDFAKS
jgi:hypothetical protein